MPDQSPQDAPYLIVGLGNPGPRYARTRHNAGFMAVDELARRHGMRLQPGQANSETARGNVAGVRVLLVKPQTYMNESGRSVQTLTHYYKVPRERTIVVYDDIALPLGTLRLREKGSSGGHNGIESIIRHLGTQAFPRLRIGVDPPPGGPGKQQVDWVLGRFTKEEQTVMDEVLARAADAIESVLTIGMERAMNLYNAKDEGRKTKDGVAAPVSRPAPMEGDGKAELQSKIGNPKSKIEETWVDRARRILQGKEGKE